MPTAGTPAISLHTQRGSARLSTIPEEEVDSRKFVYMSCLTVFHLNSISIIITGLKIVFNVNATNW